MSRAFRCDICHEFEAGEDTRVRSFSLRHRVKPSTPLKVTVKVGVYGRGPDLTGKDDDRFEGGSVCSNCVSELCQQIAWSRGLRASFQSWTGGEDEKDEAYAAEPSTT